MSLGGVVVALALARCGPRHFLVALAPPAAAAAAAAVEAVVGRLCSRRRSMNGLERAEQRSSFRLSGSGLGPVDPCVALRSLVVSAAVVVVGV